MPLKQRPLRVLLAQLSPKNLPYLSDVISAESGIELIEVKDTPENIWKQVITRSPDITVFYAPIFEEAELRCINHILRGVYSRILVVTDETSVSKVPQDAKIEIFALNKDRVPNKALAEELVYRCKEIGPLKKTADPKAEPEAPAVSVSEADAPLMKHLIAIGASTGGTEALAQLFHMLPEHIPGIVVVQHMPPVFTRMYAERLNKSCPLR
jgi:two-component system chemotaxis response regulator CheB